MSDCKERRNYLRLDKVFPVQVESTLFGFSNCIARNISCGGMFLESRELLPLGSSIKVLFTIPGECGGIAAYGEVKNQYYLNFGSDEESRSVIGMGIRFSRFDDDGLSRLNQSLSSTMQMH